MYNEQCILGAGSAAILVQAVGLQGSVTKEPHGQYRTPEVCGEPGPADRTDTYGKYRGATRGQYVRNGMRITLISL